MGNCKIKEIYDNSESQKEVNMDNNDNSIIKKFKKNNSNEKKNKKLKFFNKIKLHGKKEYNYKNGILENKKPNSNLNIIGNDNNLGNNDELIIITPRLNSNIASETYLNDITDEFTIKNETLVYINEYISNKESESKKVMIRNVIQIFIKLKIIIRINITILDLVEEATNHIIIKIKLI